MGNISYRVSKIGELKDLIYYKVDCSCGENKHAMTLELEYDKNTPDMVFLNIFKELSWSSYWGTTNIFSRIWKRIKGSLTLFFKGYINVEESFIFQGEEHIKTFLDAVNEGLNKIKENR